jgi:Sensory domain in DIguanylate Cyclases and Two-component system
MFSLMLLSTVGERYCLMENKENKAKSSLFEDLLQTSQPQPLPATYVKRAGLVEIVQAYKKAIIESRQPVLVFTNLQPLFSGRQVHRWYRKLVERAQLVCVFMPALSEQILTDATGLPPAPNELFIELPPDHELTRDWFIIVTAPTFSAIVCAQSSPGVEAAAEKSDLIKTLISYDPPVIQYALDFLTGQVRFHRPAELQRVTDALLAQPPQPPDPRFLTLLSYSAIRQVGFYHKQTRKTHQDNAMRATIARLLHDASQPVTTLLTLLELGERLNQLDEYEMKLLLKAANDLKQILDQLREVNRFRTREVQNTQFLETGMPMFDASE